MPGRPRAPASGCPWCRAIHENTSIAVPSETRPATSVASGWRSLPAARRQQPGADVRHHQRRDEVGAAAGVLAVGLAQSSRRRRPALEGGDALVLGAVVARQLGVAHGEKDGQQRGAGDRELAGDRRPAPPRRRATDTAAPPSEAASRRGSSCGSTGAPVARRTAGSTASASPSRTSPRASGKPLQTLAPGQLGLAPELTLMPPASSRTAAAQKRRLCSSTPSRSAMPPSCSGASRSSPAGGASTRSSCPRLHHPLDASHSLTDALVVLHQGEAHEAVAERPKPMPGETATFASLSSSLLNSSDPRWR